MRQRFASGRGRSVRGACAAVAAVALIGTAAGCCEAPRAAPATVAYCLPCYPIPCGPCGPGAPICGPCGPCPPPSTQATAVEEEPLTRCQFTLPAAAAQAGSPPTEQGFTWEKVLIPAETDVVCEDVTVLGSCRREFVPPVVEKRTREVCVQPPALREDVVPPLTWHETYEVEPCHEPVRLECGQEVVPTAPRVRRTRDVPIAPGYKRSVYEPALYRTVAEERVVRPGYWHDVVEPPRTERRCREGIVEPERFEWKKVPACNLELTVNGPSKAKDGEQISFTVNVTNKGGAPGSDCVLRLCGDWMDQGTEDVAIGALAPGQTWAKEWMFQVLQPGVVRTLVQARCGQCDARLTYDVEAQGLAALQTYMADKDLAGVEKGVFEVGDEFQYVLRVENDQATQVSPALWVVFTLPDDLEFVAGVGGGGRIHVTAVGSTVTTSKFRLDRDQAVLIQVRVRAKAAPEGNLTKMVASVKTVGDVEIATETESTTIRPAGAGP